MSFHARGDSPRADEGEIDAEIESDAFALEDLEDAAFSPLESAENDPFARPLRRPLRRNDSGASGDADDGSGGQATRLLEALEALSSEAGGAMPPSLRSLLGQLQGDENAMAGLFPFMQMLDSHGSQPRFQRMLQALDADAPAHVQQSGLADLCESLSMSSEESLAVSGFSVDKFLPPVIRLIRAPPTMEVLLMAARTLAAMFDLFPSLAVPKAMKDESLVASICGKLLEIEYMDVAELAFQILERIVFCLQTETDYRRAVIAANGFVALLQFVDFFPIEIQRTAARVVAGLCTKIDVESTAELQAALPMIVNLLRSSDAEIMGHGCKSFESLSASPAFVASADFALLVASEDTCETLAQLLDRFAHREDESSSGERPTPLSVTSCASVLRLMSAVLSAPHEDMDDEVKLLRFSRLPPIVAKLLSIHAIVEDVTLLRETLKLVTAILPPPQDIEQHESQLQHETIRAFTRAVLPCVIHVHEVSGRTDVRFDCLGVVLRVCLLQQHIDHIEQDFAELGHLSSFLARVLRPEGASGTGANTKNRNFCVALQVVQACLHSDSSVSSYAKALFERHGVSAAIRCFAVSEAESEGEGVSALANLLVSEYLGEDDSASESSIQRLGETVKSLEAAMNEEDSEFENLKKALRSLLTLCREILDSTQSAGVWLTAHEIASSGLSRSLTRVLQDADSRRVFADVLLNDPGERSTKDFVDGLIASVQDAISAEKDAFRVGTVLRDSSIPISTGSVTHDVDQLAQHIKVKVKIEDDEGTSSSDVKRNKRLVHDTVVLVEPLARIDTIEEFIAEKLFGSRAAFGALEDEAEEEVTGPRHRRRGRRGDNDAEEKQAEEDNQADEEDDGDDHDDLRSDRPQKKKRLHVLFGGTAMHGDSSVLEAILKSGDAEGPEPGSGGDLTKVWSGSPHEFVFRVITKGSSKTDGRTGENTASSTGDPATLKVSRSETSTSHPKWWDDVWDLLEILKHLHELLDGSSQSPGFVNPYISLQVNRALTQPVRVMTNSLPPWSFRVVEKYPFVLDYETRYDFMFATTSGAPRAISYLCRTLWKKAATAEEPTALATSVQDAGRVSRRSLRDRNGGSSRSAATALSNLSRMAKLPRLKVRVARSRLLQSAMKLFTMYGGKKAIIEIEFLGEVGTGLGPTTEFYTLVCHELQASHLKLWRNDKDVPVDERDVSDVASDVDKKKQKKQKDSDKTKKPGLPVRGYHRVAVYHCPSCKHLEVPRCAIHDQLLTYEKAGSDEGDDRSSVSIPQCAKCLDARDWNASYVMCKSCGDCNKDDLTPGTVPAAAASEDSVERPANDPLSHLAEKKKCTLRWWILSEEEVLYLRKVYPRDVETIKHPVLQCSHCDTVNFPGTDAGIVVLDHTGERMVSRAGRRMYERDYRAVTKHVSPLCEGTPLKQIGVVLTRDAVETLVDCTKRSPELLDSEVESLSYMSEVAMQGEVEVVDAPFGLFPKPLTAEKENGRPQNGLSWFNFMGRFVAQAILDERLLNLPLSRAFLRALRGEALAGPQVDVEKSIEFVGEVDPAIAHSLAYLHKLATQSSGERPDANAANEAASVVDSMCLAFTLVGDASIELCDDGANVAVDVANLSEYVRLNVAFLLEETIKKQVAAFHDGFQVISGIADARHFLRGFSLAELEFLLADKCLPGDSMWSRDGKELREHMVCDHGYTPQSRAIHDLVAVLCEMPLDEQRLFVKFVTGANRLPLGGLAKLEPKLTVVRKLAASGDGEDAGADAVLPSASTCTNYLKLPEYSTREAMRERLGYCIHEGQGSFHLS